MFYPLIKPYCYANIYWDKRNYVFFYEIKEVALNDEEKNIYELAEIELRDLISENYEKLKTIEEKIQHLKENFDYFLSMNSIILPEQSYLKILYYLYKEFVGYNEIEPLIRDPLIEDISCDGVNIPIYILYKKIGNLPTNIIFKDEEKLQKLIEKLAQRSGKYVSYSQPILDTSLPEGHRVNITYSSDITTRGPTFTIRKFSQTPLTPLDLIRYGSANELLMAIFWLGVQYKRNFLIIGETASGKTTLLNAISLFMPKTAKIVTIEDTREINLPFENWIPAVSRTGIGSLKVGEITLFDLLKASLRQNPDYLIVGEVRGEETNVLFQGMASGHSSFATFHANSMESVIARLTTPPINLPESLIGLLDFVILTVKTKEKRVVKLVYEVFQEKRKVNYQILASYDFSSNGYYFNHNSKVFEKISNFFGLHINELWHEVKLRALILNKLKYLNIDWKTFSELINLYYVNREHLFKILKIQNS
ncbi:MAG: type II/IV secretion system ATPase subunit [Nanoarchaeota archaeon]